MRNNEGEWFKALLATGGCSLLLTLFLRLLPSASVFVWSFSILMFFSFCYFGWCFVMMANPALSCLAFWYGMLCFAFCCFSFMFCCLFCYSLVFCAFLYFDYIWRCEYICSEWRNWIAKLSKGFTERNPIGPLDPLWNQNLSIHPVHSGFLDLGLRSPIRPVHEPGGSKQTYYILLNFYSTK